VYGNGYVEDNEEPNDINMRKVMSLLEKVEVSCKLVMGMNTDMVTCKYGVNKKFFSSRKMNIRSRKTLRPEHQQVEKFLV
jgi:hypothetical protein